MATILEGLNAISQAVGGAGEAESNLEALNQISEALGGSADATENAEAIANIAENASGGGGSGSLKYGEVTINVASDFPMPNVEVQTIIDGMFSYVPIERGSSGKMIVPLMVIPDDNITLMSGASALNMTYQTNMKVTATGGTAYLVKAGTMAVLNLQSEPNNTNMTVTLSKAS